MNVYAPELLLHRVGVDLAHVTASIELADLSDFQSPRVHVLVQDGVPIVVGDYSALERQHSLVGHSHPSHLQSAKNIRETSQKGVRKSE